MNRSSERFSTELDLKLLYLRRAWRMLGRPLSRVLSPLWGITLEILLTRDLTSAVPVLWPAVDVTVRTATADDLGWVIELYRQDPYLYLGEPSDGPGELLKENAYSARLRRGEKCFLAFADSQIAHVNWLCFTLGEEPVPGRHLLLKSGECYTTDAITLDRFKGKGLHSFVLGEMLRSAQSSGCHTAITVTNIDHLASFKAFAELGYQISAYFLCFEGRKLSRNKKSVLFRISGNIESLLR